MLTRLDLRGVTGDLAPHLPRAEVAGDGPLAAVREIIAEVRAGGDAALRALTLRFDGVEPEHLRVPPAEVAAALEQVDPTLRAALEQAHEAIVAFNEFEAASVVGPHRFEREGLVVESVRRPVDRAGIYVPGGRGAYPSTVLMTAVAARVAGVRELALCVPPDRDGRVHPAVLAAAALCGVDEVHPVGGAQAIAALAYGTESIRPVDVIVGPGNVFVALAKREVSGEVGVPSAFAGPSEIVVVADDSTPPRFAAVDLVVQAEHGPHGVAWLISWSPDVVDGICAEVAALVADAPRRADIEATLGEGGYAVLVDDRERAIEVANAIAPEHLQLMCADPEALVPSVRHAGAVFCGPLAPASIGDYIAGPSHVLPTNGTARFGSALTVDDFQKRVHVVTLDAAAFERVGPAVQVLAETEGFDAHAESVRVRLASLEARLGAGS
jgi:histidinol dehydrogenase